MSSSLRSNRWGPERTAARQTTFSGCDPRKTACGSVCGQCAYLWRTEGRSKFEDAKEANRFEALGIPFETDAVDGQQTVSTLGLTFDFSDGVKIRSKSERAWRLWAATRGLLRRRRISGDMLRVWLGHVNFHFLLCRPLLSCLTACYKFSSAHLGHRFPMWDTVRKEMRMVLGLIFVVEKDLSANYNTEVHIGDSSDKGYGLMSTTSTVDRVKREMRYDERWRFVVGDEQTHALACNGGPINPGDCNEECFSKGCSAEAGVGGNTLYGKLLKSQLQDTQVQRQIERKKRRIFGQKNQIEQTVIECHSIPPISNHWEDVTQWDLVASGAWRHPEEHINIKEAKVMLMSLRRLCRTTKNLGTRCLSITDSMVTILALSKGRSGSNGLNRVCKRAAAYQVAGSIQWGLRHITTDVNPADAPSRQFGADFIRPFGKSRCCRGREPTLDTHISVDSLEQSGGTIGTATASRKPPERLGGQESGRKFFLELFAGTGRLSEAIKRRGLKTLPCFEVENGEEFNLLDPKVQSFVGGLLRSGEVWYVHFGTPCCIWSRARHNIRNFRKARQKERHGVACALFTARMIRLCLRHGVMLSLENPYSSRLWEFLPIQDLFRDRRISFVKWDMCQFGAPHRKRTGLMCNHSCFLNLGRQCQGGHKHDVLKGNVRVKEGGRWKYANKTQVAGAYPKKIGGILGPNNFCRCPSASIG